MGRQTVPGDGQGRQPANEEDQLRGECYALLAGLLCEPPSESLLALTADIDGDETSMGLAFTALTRTAAQTGTDAVAREFQDLFIGVGSGELKPYGSYYLTGFLYEKPLAKLRHDMAQLGIARLEDVKEPEDHIASLCEIMAGLISGEFGGKPGVPADLQTQQWFFQRHLAPWAQLFFTDLEQAASARFYVPVGTIGRLFMEIETTAFEMAA
ncbi:MAG: molecular chaperone TorD family protein [Proteobacteria bacterium]|nr:molecular chaperone TorD family protein [Pseudomonadota bacterium]